MESNITIIRKKIAAGLIAFASVFAIATSKFERDPQSCGMITMAAKKRKFGAGHLSLMTFIFVIFQFVVSSKVMANTADPFDQVKQVKAGLLDVGYVEAGPSDGEVVLLIHGWPYDIYSYKEVSKILAGKGYRVLIPYLRGYGSTRFLSEATARNGQQSVFAVDMIAFLDALKVKKAIVGGFDWGARTADIMAALWPDRVKGLVSVSGYLIGSQAGNKAPLAPKAELAWWYQFYFATERGQAGYEANTAAFNKLIWQTASPTWKFSEATYTQSAASFSNPDHVKIVIDNYRWRLGIVKGESKYDELEAKLAKAPAIAVPTVTLEGDANGAPHPDPSQYASRFTGKYMHHTISGGIGHNLPQEAPQAFADAIVEVAGFVKSSQH